MNKPDKKNTVRPSKRHPRIVRLDFAYTAGFQVRYYPTANAKGRYKSKLFSDSAYGSRARSLAAATRFTRSLR